MLQPLESVVETLINGAQSLREFTYAFALGNLTRIDLLSDTVAGSGGATFDVLLNGSTIFPGGGGRPTIAAGATTGSVTGLATAVARFDKLRVTCASAPSGGIGGKLYIMLTFDDGVAGGQSRQTVVFTTTSLADGAEDSTHTVALAKSFVVLSIATDFAARVRIYSTSAYRTADASRNETTLPSGLHGVVEDTVTATGALTDNGSPYPPGTNLEGSPSANIPIAVKNKSGATRAINVTIVYQPLEV